MNVYSSNMGEVIAQKLAQLKALKNNADPIMREVALVVLPELRQRVHRDGKDSSGNQIGTYSPGYMVVRTGSYKNAKRGIRGVDKGKLKDAGKFTKKGFTKFTQEDEETVSSSKFFLKLGKNGEARPKFHRSDDTKVILSLTRQMEGDTSVLEGNYEGASVVKTGTGYGIGYLNPLNYQKALWCEATYKKPILTKLTEGEEVLAYKTASEFTENYLKTK